MTKRFEIWAGFEDGIEVMIEAHDTLRNAKLAIDAMGHRNEYELSIGYGFPHGVPVYYIIKK